MKINTKEIITMFYIERSVHGPCLCSDLHDCFGMDSKGLGWFRDGSYAVAFPTKEEAEAFCKSHKLNLDADKNGYEPLHTGCHSRMNPRIRHKKEKLPIMLEAFFYTLL